ncbi:MAG TPA: DUF4350 domain-containing protein [Terriglobales bacterium]
MPLRLDKSDRRLMTWASLIFLAMILALALLSSNEERDSGVPNTYSAHSSGAKAAYLLLGELGYHTVRWEQPPEELPVEPAQTVLVLASPLQAPSRDERLSLESYLNRGGKILITGSRASSYLPHVETEEEPVPEPIPKLYQPQTVSTLTRGGPIRMSPTAYWRRQGAGVMVHYSDNDRPIVVSYKVGKGEVVWWAASTPLSNAGIKSAGNVELLLGSLGEPGPTRILWDEYFHSSRGSIASYLTAAPIMWGLAQGGLIVLAMIFTYSRRNGPIYPASEPSRLSPLEFVETLGGLYRRARAVRVALEVPYTRFRMLATRQLGLKTDIPAHDLARAVRYRLSYRDDNVQELLQAIETAMYDPELREDTVLKLVQQLNVHTRRLQLISFERQEITSHADSVPGAHTRTN